MKEINDSKSLLVIKIIYTVLIGIIIINCSILISSIIFKKESASVLSIQQIILTEDIQSIIDTPDLIVE